MASILIEAGPSLFIEKEESKTRARLNNGFLIHSANAR
jgi:hypothetical protein